jgi:PPOX class probable F420-dependent enzyme
MPPPPVPPELDTFLHRPNHAVVGTLRADGSPHTVPSWYVWEEGRALLSLDESRLRLGLIRRDPRVALTVLDHEDWSRHVSLLGRIVSIEEDVDLHDIDRLALCYTGERFRTRDPPPLQHLARGRGLARLARCSSVAELRSQCRMSANSSATAGRCSTRSSQAAIDARPRTPTPNDVSARKIQGT